MLKTEVRKNYRTIVGLMRGHNLVALHAHKGRISNDYTYLYKTTKKGPFFNMFTPQYKSICIKAYSLPS